MPSYRTEEEKEDPAKVTEERSRRQEKKDRSKTTNRVFQGRQCDQLLIVLSKMKTEH